MKRVPDGLLQAGLRTARLRTALHGLQAGVRGLRRGPQVHRLPHGVPSSTSPSAATPSASRSTRNTKCRCITAPTGRSTSSTWPSAATPSASRCYQEYEVPVSYCTCKPVYEQHVMPALLHRLQAGATGIPGPGPLLHLQAGLRAARRPALLHRLQAGLHGMRSAGPLLHLPAGVRTAHLRGPGNLLPHRPGAAHLLLQDLLLRAGLRRTSASRSARAATRRCRRTAPARSSTSAATLPGTCTFDPCTCTSHYCPGPTVNYEVQCPGHYECHSVWVPHEEVRTIRCCHYVRMSNSTPAAYTVCQHGAVHRHASAVLHHLPHGLRKTTAGW